MALSLSPFLFPFPTVRNTRFFPATTPRSLVLESWPRRGSGWHDRGHTAAAAVLAEDLAVRAGEDLPEDYASRHPAGDPSRRRRAGVLLHPTSLPGPYGIGDLGDQALRFLDWLHSAGCSIWQVLPLVPPGRKSKESVSPYAGQDANCDLKDPLIAKAAERLLQSRGELKKQLDGCRKDPRISGWLEDAALFAAIDHSVDKFSWYVWPEPLKNCHLSALEDKYQNHKNFPETFIGQQFFISKTMAKNSQACTEVGN